ncbi:hypothetical protein H1P_1830015 [Hyella patelloides LEGE 07179]|uniref:Uncharacterized protein n=1 Tax=Hyella patelloides LEGE 07179 TaxID=945734 RepID=A0A563VPA8_9CYAN|nr:hypothetical protein [Hyella patelloides]VEP13117.1 hypothetical protein H1P_1830015 [Hyella patelloides LEGE 07179]
MNLSLIKKYGVPSANLACDVLTQTISPKSVLTAGKIIITLADDINSIKTDNIAEHFEIDGDKDHGRAMETLNREYDLANNQNNILFEVKILLNTAIGSYRFSRERLENNWLVFDRKKYARYSNKEIICFLERAYCCLLINEKKLCDFCFFEARKIFYRYVELLMIDYLKANKKIDIDNQEILSLAKEIEKQEKNLLEIAKILKIDPWKLTCTLIKESKEITNWIEVNKVSYRPVTKTIYFYKFKRWNPPT